MSQDRKHYKTILISDIIVYKIITPHKTLYLCAKILMVIYSLCP